MSGISRVNGNAAAGAFYGYSATVLKIAGTNIGTASTGGGTTAITEGNFEKSIRALQTIASIVYIGTRADDQFVVIVDAPTAQPTGPAYNTDATPTVTERVKAVLDAATGVTTTITDISGLAAGTLA